MTCIVFTLLFLLCTTLSAHADITSNLVAWWKFDDNTGTTAVDSSGNANTATLTGTTLPSWTSTNCAVPPCLSFDGATSRLTVASSSSDDITTTDFTLAARVYPTTVNSAYHFIIEKNSTTVPNFQLVINSANQFRFIYEWSGGSVTVNSDSAASANTSYCVVGVATRAGTSVLYVNGVLQASQPASNATTLTNAAGLTIGAQNTANLWAGTIDDLRMYKRALTSTDVTEYCAFTEARRRNLLLY